VTATPVGDYLRRRYPPNPGATHWLGSQDDPGCCAGPHPLCTYQVAQREALLSLAADLEDCAATTKTLRGSAYAIGAFSQAAEMARQRLEGPPSTTAELAQALATGSCAADSAQGDVPGSEGPEGRPS
jgi:hypothetical protein